MNKSIKYGLLTGAALIVYFLLMKLAGLEGNFALRFVNFFILISGCYLLLRSIYSGKNADGSYFSGLVAGVVLSVTAVITFTAFMALYVLAIDPEFMKILENSQIWGNHLELEQAAFAIIIEGMASGVVITYSLMQYFKRFINDGVKRA
ncbi:MAG: DUF4199 domain-containing protein [Cryomorphaceae bacterium]|nr:DUF4199 domain-containing protein [Flavobacteriales bacterium]